MKEAEISQLAPSASGSSRGPRYRYYSNPPTTVSLRLADLAAQIPEAARLPGFNGEHSVELSCEEIFSGLTPKLPLSRLAEIASEHVRTDGLQDHSIRLPVARVAVAFRFINGRELIEEPPPPEVVKSPEDSAPKAETAAAPELQKAAGNVDEVSASAGAGSSPAPPDAKSSSGEVKVFDAASSSPSEPPKDFSASVPGDEASEHPKPEENEAWRPIPVFPIFRRKITEPQVKPPVAPLRPVVEPSPPGAPLESPEVPAKSEQEAKPELTEGPARESMTPPVQAEAVLVESERHSEPLGAVEILDQDSLQAVFMTEERLSVDRVVELCGGLPGIKSCVLAHGAEVIASHNVPESIDLVSLSAHALEMLSAMRQSAARMGVGAVPAVTIHAEKGPITFFHQDDLCLLVMHKDRGFVPGVREKLQHVVEHLAQSSPALAAEGARLAGGPRKPAG